MGKPWDFPSSLMIASIGDPRLGLGNPEQPNSMNHDAPHREQDGSRFRRDWGHLRAIWIRQRSPHRLNRSGTAPMPTDEPDTGYEPGFEHRSQEFLVKSASDGSIPEVPGCPTEELWRIASDLPGFPRPDEINSVLSLRSQLSSKF